MRKDAEWLSISEYARKNNLHTQVLYRAIRAKRFPVLKLGKLARINPGVSDSWIPYLFRPKEADIGMYRELVLPDWSGVFEDRIYLRTKDVMSLLNLSQNHVLTLIYPFIEVERIPNHYQVKKENIFNFVNQQLMKSVGLKEVGK